MDDTFMSAQVTSLLASSQTPVVYVVDDDISVGEALEGLIQAAGWQPAVCGCAQAFLDEPPIARPHCAILDIGLPDLNGLDLQERIVAERPETPIIFITGSSDVPMTVRAMKAGAVEFLIKPFGDDVLIEAIRGALQRSAMALAAGAEMQALKERYASLSPREREVMALVTTGLMNKQVGGKLGISEITVKAHRGQVMRKMEASSLADLVGIAAKLGLGK